MKPQQYDRVRDAFVQAAALEGEAQREFMRTLRGQDPEVFAEVASLLEYDSTRTLVDVRGSDMMKAMPTTAVGADAPTIQVKGPPASGGRLAVIRRISRGSGRSLLWSLLGLGLLMAVGYAALSHVQSSLEDLIDEELQVVADARVATLSGWFLDVPAVGETASASETVRNAVWPLLNRENPPDTAAGLEADAAQDDLADALAEIVLQDVNRAIARERRVRRRQNARTQSWGSDGYEPDLQLRTVEDVRKTLRYALWTADRRLVANWDRDPAAYTRMESDEGSKMLGRVFAGETVIYVPSGRAYLRDYRLKKRPEVSVTAPIIGDDGRVAAAVLIGGIFQESYDGVLREGDFKESGETYVVLPGGIMGSQSRFGEVLSRAGLIETRSPVTGRSVPATSMGSAVRSTPTARGCVWSTWS